MIVMKKNKRRPQKSKKRKIIDRIFGRAKHSHKEHFPKTKKIDGKNYKFLDRNSNPSDDDRKIYREVGWNIKKVDKGKDSAIYVRKRR